MTTDLDKALAAQLPINAPKPARKRKPAAKKAETKAPVKKAAAKKAPAKKAPVKKAAKPAEGQSKMELATAVFKKMKNKTRAEVLVAFQEQAGLTVAGSATYYSTIKKRLEQ